MQNGYVPIDLNLQLFGQVSSTSRQDVVVFSLVAGALKFHFVILDSLCIILLKLQKLIQSNFLKRSTKFLSFELLSFHTEDPLFYRICSILLLLMNIFCMELLYPEVHDVYDCNVNILVF